VVGSIISGELSGVGAEHSLFGGYFIGVASRRFGLLMGYFVLLQSARAITEVPGRRSRAPPTFDKTPVFGIDDEMKVLDQNGRCFQSCSIYSGVRSVDRLAADRAHLGVTGWRADRVAVRRPHIFTRMRSGPVALIVMVISEMVAASSGIGYFILSAQRGFKIRDMFAGVLTLAVVGYVLNRLFVAIENRVLAWHYGYTQQQRN
jgi:hypothetical protein